jgi:adenine-specific DNA methylase
LARWENSSEAIKQLYSRQALPMIWDFVEANPFSGSSGSFEAGQEYYLNVIFHLSQIPNPLLANGYCLLRKIIQSSSTSSGEDENEECEDEDA